MTLLYRHEAENAERSVVLRIIIKDKHVYEINDNVKQLQQMVNYEDDERDKLKVSDKYRIIEKTADIKEVYCVDLQEILESVKINSEVKELKYLVIITPASLSEILVKIIESGYTQKYSTAHSYTGLVYLQKHLIFQLRLATITRCTANQSYLKTLKNTKRTTIRTNIYINQLLKRSILANIITQ